MPLFARVVWAIACCLLATACGTARSEREDAGGSAACACSATEFCCVGRCQLLGTVCGDGGATPADTGATADATADAAADPCAPRTLPDGTTVTPHAACSGDTLLGCDGDPWSRVCGASTHCLEWYDAPTGAWAACLADYQRPCDPATAEPARCDGVLAWGACTANPAYPDGPPGNVGVTDCRSRLGDDAICVDDGSGPRCSTPSATPCDPATYRDACAADGVRILYCLTPEAVVVTRDCPDAGVCLDSATALSLTGGNAVCVGAGWVPSDRAPTLSREAVRCEGEDRIRYQQYGVEWSEACVVHLASPSGVEDVAGVCWMGVDGPRCELPGTEHCDPATFMPRCDMATHTEYTCEGDRVVPRFCEYTVGGETYEGVCDPGTGRCIATEPCFAGFYHSRCVAGGAYRMVCLATHHEAVPMSCPACTMPSDGSDAVCGSTSPSG